MEEMLSFLIINMQKINVRTEALSHLKAVLFLIKLCDKHKHCNE